MDLVFFLILLIAIAGFIWSSTWFRSIRLFALRTWDGLKIITSNSFWVIRERDIFLAVMGVSAACLPGAILYHTSVEIPSNQIPVYIGVLLGIIGLLLRLDAGRRTARRQHTINVLREHRFGDIFEKHLERVHARYPVGTILSVSEVGRLIDASCTQGLPNASDPSLDDPDSVKAVYRSIVVILNYYEFLAIAIKRRDLDPAIMKDFYRSLLTRFCEKTWRFIWYVQQESPRTYQNLIDLYLSWKPAEHFPHLDLIKLEDADNVDDRNGHLNQPDRAP